MCRYGMTIYKPHLACFTCRKTFKRKLLRDILSGYNKNISETPAKCPECDSVMADMGLDFESPKKKDVKAWKHIEMLYEVDITFHSCGCTGPGYIPKDKEELIAYFLRIKDVYIKHQHFWARRKEDPETQSKIAKDKYQNREFLYQIPKKIKKGTKNKPEYDANKAQVYWGEKIADIQHKIKVITNTI